MKIANYSNGRLVASRSTAQQLRVSVEQALGQQRDVVLDFSGVSATQPFIDELIGVLILKRGPIILDRLVFQSCSDDTRAVIEFVATDRSNQFNQQMKIGAVSART